MGCVDINREFAENKSAFRPVVEPSRFKAGETEVSTPALRNGDVVV